MQPRDTDKATVGALWMMLRLQRTIVDDFCRDMQSRSAQGALPQVTEHMHMNKCHAVNDNWGQEATWAAGKEISPCKCIKIQ